MIPRTFDAMLYINALSLGMFLATDDSHILVGAAVAYVVSVIAIWRGREPAK